VVVKPAGERNCVEPALGVFTHDRQIDDADQHHRAADLLEDDGSAAQSGIDRRDLHCIASPRLM
jgi:hypothetical protein